MAAPQQGGMEQFQQQPNFTYTPYNQMDWQNFQATNVRQWEGSKPEELERKGEQLKAGGELSQAHPAFEGARGCKDVFFALLFLATAGSMIGYSALKWDEVNERLTGANLPSLTVVGTAAGASTGASLFICLFWITLMSRAPSCVVWTSLILSPCIIIAIGLGLMVLEPIFGAIMVAIGLCSLGCVCICWRPFIPFTIELTEVLAGVIKEYPAMMFVSLQGGIFGMMWPIATIVTMLASADLINDAQNPSNYYVYGFVFLFLWGTQVAYYYTHTCLCGVFGRWYYQKETSGAVTKAVMHASTTAFGSICFGAFLVALIRTVEFAIRQARIQAQEEGNMVLTVVLCVLECVVSLIGDMLEWFSEWAYVQVAVRGTSFIQSAQITYTMCTCGNVDLIIADLLIDSVANLAVMLCAAGGAVAGGAAVFLSFPNDNTFVGGGMILGLITGVMVGSAAGAMVTSGSKTILASWAEDPEKLKEKHPKIHEKFVAKAAGNHDIND